jgi:NAD(P)-dependent dehydrogenase (short-subunit alcohol dehydrogenase family)
VPTTVAGSGALRPPEPEATFEILADPSTHESSYMPPPISVKAADVSVQEFAKAALEQKTEDWERTFATNSVSVAFNTLAFLELLDAGNKKGNCAGRKSQVIVTSSIAGYLRVPANFGVYPASKAGMSSRKMLCCEIQADSIQLQHI